MTEARSDRPFTLLIAALGGEGGGVLTGWIVRAAELAGLRVQNTSIPGVAQRTGATTYYVEIFPVPEAELGGREPVLSLYPSVGDIDVMVASELIEAGRAIQSGYVSPDRTTLIASTHRIYAIGERTAMADGRFDGARILEASEKRSLRPLLADFDAVAKAERSSLNAVLLGIVAAHGGLPVPRHCYEEAIREQGIAVDANLRGFERGLAMNPAGATGPAAPGKRRRQRAVAKLEERARAELPPAVHEVVVEAIRRLADYQGPRYAARYLDRLAPVLDAERTGGGDGTLVRETARHLALWMSYEDVIRVAQLKSHPDRYARVLEEVKARDGEPVIVTEFFKPGIDELCAVLPGFLARPLLGAAERRGWIDRVNIGLHVRTTSVSGFLQLWLLSRLRGWRPLAYRFGVEQARIEVWLERILRAAEDDVGVALEIAQLATLNKGYGDTYRRGAGNFARIFQSVVDPILAGAVAPDSPADAIANARVAALSDPSGKRLDAVIAAVVKQQEVKQAAE